ncbi:hypothetical protein DQ384_05135 [Sphaerisporangium album]|uniref:Uncharacterized protein n=1 Tax=Sphaerisporangium album TaxID=509200 RepID=A0A367FPU8_9ACTN|nr:hypothetical protein [Sphaerisporangium album]RCG31929.1 hypothetical protein DQ384_05135 [Sphaerisporangium album]
MAARAPMSRLAKLARILARPEMERRSYWRLLAGRDHWAVILITHGRPGEPPERQPQTPRIRPEFLRRTGADLTPEQLLHERIGQYLRADAQGAHQMDVAAAAAIATTAAAVTLAELGIDLTTLARRADQRPSTLERRQP